MFQLNRLSFFKKNNALIGDNGIFLKYSEIIDHSKKIKKKIKKNKTFILLISENTIGSILFYISSMINNHVIIFIDSKSKLKDIRSIEKTYRPAYIVAPDNWIKKNNKKKYKICLGLFETTMVKTKYRDIKINKNLAMLLPTSGSLGSKKYVRISKKNIESNTIAIIKYLKINSQDKAITNMPFNYSYMLSILNTHLYSGASLYVTQNSMLQKSFWDFFKANKITSINGVPYIYEILLKLGLKNVYHSKLKYFTQAGGKLEIKLIKKIFSFTNKKMIKFFTMYGQTEASPRMTYLLHKSKKKLGSIGKTLDKSKIWLVDENEKKINQQNVSGELVFKGEGVSMGYANNYKDLNKGDENKKILKTGDLAYYDKDNFFYITGRKKRITKIFGNRFNLDEIEKKMSQKGYKIACKEVNNFFVVFFENKTYVKTVIDQLSNITNQNKIAFKSCWIKNFPRTASGKINYAELNEINYKC